MSDTVRSYMIDYLSQNNPDACEHFMYSSGPHANYAEIQTLNSQSFPEKSYSSAITSLHSVVQNSDKVKVKDFYDFLYSLTDKSLNSYPQDIILPGIRFISDNLLIFERPPTMKPYAYTPAYRESIADDSKVNEFYIPIPWQVYVCTYDPKEMYLINVKMLFTSSSLSSFDDNVFTPPLLNFYSNGTLCRPFFSSMEDIDKYPKTYSGIMASAYDWIWNSGTNFDITENISEFLRSKKFTQFQKYIPHDSPSYSSYSTLVSHPLNSVPTLLHKILVRSFFDCYSCVPLKDICFIEFSSPSTSEFYYQENPSISDMANQYADEQSLTIHESNTDLEEHDDDYCPHNCIYYEEIVTNEDFNNWYKQQCNNLSEKSLRFVCQSSIKQLADMNYFKNFSSTAFENRIYQILQNITAS